MLTGYSLRDARSAILPLAVAQWILVYCIYFVDKWCNGRTLKVLVGAVLLAVATCGVVFAQIDLYRSMANVPADLTRDNFFFSVILVEALVSIGIVFAIAFAKRNRERNQKHNCG